jgi:hypothetical protein
MVTKAPVLTHPPDLGTGTSSRHCQTQLWKSGSNLQASQTLGEKVSGHVRCRHVANDNLTSNDNVVQPVEAQVKVLHASMMLGVPHNLNG